MQESLEQDRIDHTAKADLAVDNDDRHMVAVFLPKCGITIDIDDREPKAITALCSNQLFPRQVAEMAAVAR